MSESGRYLYGIIESSEKAELGPCGMPGGDPLVYTLAHRDVAACVSNYPADGSIKMDAESCRLHDGVLASIMERFTVLPFEFGTVAPTEADVIKLLTRHRGRIKQALHRLHDRAEVIVQAFWKSLPVAAQEVLKEHAAIAHYRQEIAARPPAETEADRIKIGEMIAACLNEKRKREAAQLEQILKRASVDVLPGATCGDLMVFNGAFLVRRADFPRFEQVLQDVGQRYEGRMNFKYSGPLPPYGFGGMVLEV